MGKSGLTDLLAGFDSIKVITNIILAIENVCWGKGQRGDDGKVEGDDDEEVIWTIAFVDKFVYKLSLQQSYMQCKLL